MAGWYSSLAVRFMTAIVGGLLLVLVLGFIWESREQERTIRTEALETSRVLLEQVLAFRSFVAANQDLINRDQDGNYQFKHFNPAAVVQGAGVIFNARTGYQIKQTRAQPRLAANAPDAFERQQLALFTANPNLSEFYEIEHRDDGRYFRYMIPLQAERPCLECHGEPAGAPDVAGYPKEGYRLGEVAGALSLTMPMQTYDSNIAASLRYRLLLVLLLGGLTAGAIHWLMQRLVVQPLGQLAGMADKWGAARWEAALHVPHASKEIKQLTAAFQAMAGKLEELYRGLEDRVEERTRKLSLVNQQLEELNRELVAASEFKSRFLANMSHELRTPLTSILAFAELLEQGVAGTLNQEQREYLGDIRESGRVLLSQISNILDMSKIEVGKMELALEPFFMEKVVEEVSRIIRPMLLQKGLIYLVELDPLLPPAMGDAGKIQQVLSNLLANAVKFTPPGGKIRVSGRLAVQTVAEEGKPMVAVTVSDSGPGIPPDQREFVFEPFRQMSHLPRHSSGGTGLGLALARNLVEMHGGRISISDTPGGGSTFTFTVPVAG